MDGLVFGWDFCKDYSQIIAFHLKKMVAEPIHIAANESDLIPSVIAKKKDSTDWKIGEEACRLSEESETVFIQDLFNHENTEEYLAIFIKKIHNHLKEKFPDEEFRCLTIALPSLKPVWIGHIRKILEDLDWKKEKIHFISRSECYFYYLLNKKKELWNDYAALFDLSDSGFHYYELKINRSAKPQTANIYYEKLDDGFNPKILDTSAGGKLADQILCGCAERLMQKKSYSSILLTGKGFVHSEWAVNFIKLAGSHKRLYYAPDVLAEGAALKAYEYVAEGKLHPYVLLCEGTLSTTISLKAEVNGTEKQVAFALAGDHWHDLTNTLILLVNASPSIDFYLSQNHLKQVQKLSIPLKNLPERPKKTTKIEVQITFINENTMQVKIRDLGFGELFPASFMEIQKEICFQPT
ncbi:hypothetical protein FACS189418_0720 [Clostridia bacterium]|nr:hypothetical protein FACS189418_0720 [Clostridia bacterium]